MDFIFFGVYLIHICERQHSTVRSRLYVYIFRLEKGKGNLNLGKHEKQTKGGK